jgi:hypothetical protein
MSNLFFYILVNNNIRVSYTSYNGKNECLRKIFLKNMKITYIITFCLNIHVFNFVTLVDILKIYTEKNVDNMYFSDFTIHVSTVIIF